MPWLKRPSSLADVYTDEQTLRALRMTGLLSVVFNSIVTERKLSFGGYGVLGMCNDTAILVDFSMKKTSAYPLLSTGKYLHHIVKLQKDLKKHPGTDAAVKDIDEIIRATASMPSDLHTSPGTIMNTAGRFLATCENPIFQLKLKIIQKS